MFFRQAVLAAALLSLPAMAGAATVAIGYQEFAAGNVAGALAARDAFIGSGTVLAEDFEGFTACNGSNGATCTAGTIVSGLGTFTGVAPTHTGGGSQVDPKDKIVVRTSAPDPFGRVNVTPGGANWLDSNDVAGILWSLVLPGAQHVSKIAMILSDIDDVGKVIFKITVNGTGLTTTVAPRADTTANIGNGKLHVVTLAFSGTTSGVTIEMVNGKGDGFGIDGIRVAAVPLPAGGLMLLGALAGFGALRRRRPRG